MWEILTVVWILFIFVYVPVGVEIELPFLCSLETLYFFFEKGILTNFFSLYFLKKEKK